MGEDDTWTPTEATPTATRLPWMRRHTDRVRAWAPAGATPTPARPLQMLTSPTVNVPDDPPPEPPTLVEAPPDNELDPERDVPAPQTDIPEPDEVVPAPPPPSLDEAKSAALQLRVEELEHELAELRGRYQDSVEQLQRASFELDLRIGNDVLQLARRLAEVIMRRTVELDSEVVVSSLRAAFQLAGPLERVTVKCAPEDVATLRTQAEGVAQDLMGRWVEVAVQQGADIEPGGVLLLFEGGVVDARLPSQLDRLTAVVERAIGTQQFANAEGDDASAQGEED